MIDDTSPYLFCYTSKQKPKSFDDFTVTGQHFALVLTFNSAYLSTSCNAISANHVQVFITEA